MCCSMLLRVSDFKWLLLVYSLRATFKCFVNRQCCFCAGAQIAMMKEAAVGCRISVWCARSLPPDIVTCDHYGMDAEYPPLSHRST